VVPKGNVIPLHDHPGMLVASKLLHGELELVSFEESHGGLYSARSSIKTELDEPWYITPTNNNLHQFRAIKTCVILDLLMPPYNGNEGRTCTYYKKRAAEGLFWQLVPYPAFYMPDERDCVYNGDSFYKGFKPDLER
jgi:hypothetical protein